MRVTPLHHVRASAPMWCSQCHDDVVERDNSKDVCHTCVEEEWLTRKCCHPSEQKNDDVDSRVENPNKDHDEKDPVTHEFLQNIFQGANMSKHMKKMQDAIYLKNLDMVMIEAYHSSDDDDDKDDAKAQVSVKKDPRPNEHEVLNFLDADDAEINSAETTDKEYMDVEIEIAADSGASEHVAADTDAPTYKVEESVGSRSGQHFIGAGGHRMANRGQMKLSMRADNGRKGRDVKTTFQVARVTRPLMSVSKICDAGMSMRFTSTMAVIEDDKGKEVCRFLRKGGLYIASMKLKNLNYKPPPAPFARQGGK